MITVRTIQKKPVDEYSTGSCDLDKCRQTESNTCDWNFYRDNIEVKDWEYRKEKCPNDCADITLCSKLDHTLCPNLKGELITTWDGELGAPHVLCSYPVSVFETIEDIEVYVDKWGKDDNYNKHIMPYFCSKSVTTCPENIDKNRFRSCSRFVSNGIDGELCREWASDNDILSDKTILGYCEKYATEDCQCVSENREDVCDRNHCSNPSYLSTTTIKEKIKGCAVGGVSINNEGIKQNKSSSRNNTATIILLILIVFVVLIVLACLAYNRYGFKYFGVFREKL
tara:strand:- start:547 stop:1395 length:849 start_codon:yes stop_codon:yes gene_type:complete